MVARLCSVSVKPNRNRTNKNKTRSTEVDPCYFFPEQTPNKNKETEQSKQKPNKHRTNRTSLYPCFVVIFTTFSKIFFTSVNSPNRLCLFGFDFSLLAWDNRGRSGAKHRRNLTNRYTDRGRIEVAQINCTSPPLETELSGKPHMIKSTY